MDDSTERELKRLNQEIQANAAKLQAIEKLKSEFPDLKISTDRWNNKRYTSKSVNAIADKVDFRHNCGCCNDSPLEARPYIERDGFQIFADPDRYMVGEKSWWAIGCDDAYPNWEEKLRKEGISEAAIARVAKYLVKVAPPPRSWDDDDDDDVDVEPAL